MAFNRKAPSLSGLGEGVPARLGGNLGGPADERGGYIRAPELEAATPSYSVASDWFDFGLLAAEVVGGFKPAGNGLVALNELRRSVLTAGHLTEAERTLIGGLLTPNPDARRIECVEVPRRVTALATRLAADQRSFDRPLIMAVHLASGGELAQAIFHLSHGAIRIDDGPAQLAFVADDVSEGATVSVRSGNSQHYALHGRQIPLPSRERDTAISNLSNTLDTGRVSD